MKKNKKLIILLYILINIIIFFGSFFYMLNLAKGNGIPIDNRLLMLQSFRSLMNVIIFNSLVWLYIKFKKINIKEYLR